jgi:hypothetical protein
LAACPQQHPKPSTHSNTANTFLCRPCWHPSARHGRLLYIPVPEYFDLSRAGANAQGGAVDIVTELGPVTTHFLGSCHWASEKVFEYSVDSCRVELPGGLKFTVRGGRCPEG